MKEEKIKVLALLPMELPKEIELNNTLEAMQKFVGLACRSIVRCGMEPMFLPGRDFWPDATAKGI